MGEKPCPQTYEEKKDGGVWAFGLANGPGVTTGLMPRNNHRNQGSHRRLDRDGFDAGQVLGLNLPARLLCFLAREERGRCGVTPEHPVQELHGSHPKFPSIRIPVGPAMADIQIALPRRRARWEQAVIPLTLSNIHHQPRPSSQHQNISQGCFTHIRIRNVRATPQKVKHRLPLDRRHHPL